MPSVSTEEMDPFAEAVARLSDEGLALEILVGQFDIEGGPAAGEVRDAALHSFLPTKAATSS